MTLSIGQEVRIKNTYIYGTVIVIPDEETCSVKIKEQTIRVPVSELEELQAEEEATPLQDWSQLLKVAKQWRANTEDQEAAKKLLDAMEKVGLI